MNNYPFIVIQDLYDSSSILCAVKNADMDLVQKLIDDCKYEKPSEYTMDDLYEKFQDNGIEYIDNAKIGIMVY